MRNPYITSGFPLISHHEASFHSPSRLSRIGDAAPADLQQRQELITHFDASEFMANCLASSPLNLHLPQTFPSIRPRLIMSQRPNADFLG